MRQEVNDHFSNLTKIIEYVESDLTTLTEERTQLVDTLSSLAYNKKDLHAKNNLHYCVQH